jgi:hypothetical protein
MGHGTALHPQPPIWIPSAGNSANSIPALICFQEIGQYGGASRPVTAS